MTKTESELKELGWKVEMFQPKGEKYPWSLKISKTIQTRGLHSDAVTDKIREAHGKYVITAYLDPNAKVDVKTREARIMSALKWELIKNYKLLEKYAWLKELEEVCGKVKPLIFHKTKRKSVLKTENEKALEESKKPKESDKQKPIQVVEGKTEKLKKSSNKKTLTNVPEPSKAIAKKQVKSSVSKSKAKSGTKKTKSVKKATTKEKTAVAKPKITKKQTLAKVSGVGAKKKTTVKKAATKTVAKKSVAKITKSVKRKTK